MISNYKPLQEDQWFYGYKRAPGGNCYQIRALRHDVPDHARTTIKDPKFARYTCVLGTICRIHNDYSQCDTQLGDLVENTYMYGSKFAAEMQDRQEDGLFAFDDEGGPLFGDTFDAQGRKHGVWVEVGISEVCTVYYEHGTIHRVAPDGESDDNYPAVVWRDGKEWWVDNKKHRLGDKPAVINKSGKEWWVDGQLHRDEDLPAVDYAIKSRQEWWRFGKRCRSNDMPAIVSGTEIDARMTEWRAVKEYLPTKQEEQWTVDTDLPSWLLQSATSDFSVWFVDGAIGRDGDKPAVLIGYDEKQVNEQEELIQASPHMWISNQKKPTIKKQIWVQHGKMHRQCDDQPAYIDDSGLRIWKKDGLTHRENDLPAVEDDGMQLREWYWMGKQHRTNDRPALIDKLNNTQVWFTDGEMHRENDLPAVVSSNAQEWFWHGKRHRLHDLPAMITPRFDVWFIDNGLHRDDDKPAVVYKNGQQEWWQNGCRHRDNELPAVIVPNGHVEYWQRGLLHRGNNLPAVVVPDAKDNLHILFQTDDDKKQFGRIEIAPGTTEWWEHGMRVEKIKI